MKVFLTLIAITAVCNCAAQYNLSSLDTLFQKNASAISGKGGGLTAVLVKDGKQIYNKSIGNFDIDKQVPIASASKWYSATLIMCLVHEGKLSLDDKISKYIPSFKGGEKENITVRQCFALTGGFPGSSEALDEFMVNSRTKTFAVMVDAIAKAPFVAKPGTQINYGGLGMQVAGRVAEIVTGKSWNELFKEKLAKPLGLTKTWYGGVNIGAVPRIAGGVVSTASDYLKLLEMIFNKGVYKGIRMLSEKEVEIMLADQTNGASIGFSPFTKFKTTMNTTKDPRYGIGNWVVKNEKMNVNVSPGAFGFTPWIDREHGYYGVIAVRSAFPKVMPVFFQTIHLVNQLLTLNTNQKSR